MASHHMARGEIKSQAALWTQQGQQSPVAQPTSRTERPWGTKVRNRACSLYDIAVSPPILIPIVGQRVKVSCEPFAAAPLPLTQQRGPRDGR